MTSEEVVGETPSQEAIQAETPSVPVDTPKPSDQDTNASTDASTDASDEKVKDKKEEPVDKDPHALQIVSIGDPSDAYAFRFHEEQLTSVLAKIPPGWKVSVVSVVGAFRTGKSFLLSWFLRYLHLHSNRPPCSSNEPCLQEEEDGSSSKKWYERFESLGKDGFNWRGGAERNTTGIWMWSEPFFLDRIHPDTKEKDNIAVVLVDTQGMFDHETTMALTASIFGLSTLLSSFQIYNVDKRIQEDNLQQLALFSEYGRMALQSDHAEETRDAQGKVQKPFQRIDFLVRDWQNFEEEDDLDAMETEMTDYLESVFAERNAKDLKETREQIFACFEKVSCFMMTHPGFKVTSKKYTGDVSAMEPMFMKLLDRYCARVFHNLTPKMIHGRELTAAELGPYIKAYAKLFESGAHFPEASTMLEATASANNHNALHLSVAKYKTEMDHVAGDSYVKEAELKDAHHKALLAAFQLFESIANFGNQERIDEAREMARHQIMDHYDVYTKLNDSRNPLAGFEIILVSMFVAFVASVLHFIADKTCSEWSQTCKQSANFLSELYTVVCIFLLIVASTKFKQISDLVSKMKTLFNALQGGGGQPMQANVKAS
mmetsp:Transcript_18930/g.34315  ORF Transcript_18930/g.34315 Transcript_18930/m.34315 type:complete len:601 (-) Transcript_18930:5607-7409(-)